MWVQGHSIWAVFRCCLSCASKELDQELGIWVPTDALIGCAASDGGFTYCATALATLRLLLSVLSTRLPQKLHNF